MITRLVAAAMVLLVTVDSSAMIRVLKYKRLTWIGEDRICVTVRHEMNPKKENIGDPFNTRNPILCGLQMKVLVEPRPPRVLVGSRSVDVVGKSVLQFERLNEICTTMPGIDKHREWPTRLVRLRTFCQTSLDEKLFDADLAKAFARDSQK